MDAAVPTMLQARLLWLPYTFPLLLPPKPARSVEETHVAPGCHRGPVPSLCAHSLRLAQH